MLLGTWVVLWQINYKELYAGNNPCFSGNTISTYGEDCMMYCPNTNIISSLNATKFSINTVIFSYNKTASEIPITSEPKVFSQFEYIYIDDDDEEIGWWFNLNPGSTIDMTFNVTTDQVYIQIDDEDVGYTIPSGETGSYLYAFEEKNGIYSKGSKVSFKTDSDTVRGNVGYVNFEYKETYFDVSNASACIRPFCVYNFDYGDDFCLAVFNGNPRSWSNDYSPSCTTIIQSGRDQAYAGIIIPIAVILIVLIIIFNTFVIWFLAKRRSRTALVADEETLTSLYDGK